MKPKKVFLYYIVLGIFKCLTYGNVIKKVISIGNVNMCSVNINADELEECILNNEFGKLLLFSCNFNMDISIKGRVLPENCAAKSYVNQSNPNEYSPETDTYEIFQNVFESNNSTLTEYFSFYSTPYSNKDLDISCICYGEYKSHIKQIMKISYKKTGKKIKGCDFGDNMLSRRDLTNNVALNENYSCVIHAYPMDVVGINCYKKESNNNYNDNLELIPNNCFHNVYYGSDIILSSNNLIPNSRVIPDPATDVNLSKAHSYVSYIVFPDVITENIKISCVCKRDRYVGTMYIYTNKGNGLLFDNEDDIEQIEERRDYMPVDEEMANIDPMGQRYQEDDSQDPYDNKNSIYYNNKWNIYKSLRNTENEKNYENEANKLNRSDSKYNADYYNRSKVQSKQHDDSNSSNNSNNINNNQAEKSYNDNIYDKYNVGDSLNGGSRRRKKRTFWQNLFGLSSSQFESFSSLVVILFLLIHT
ncbi:6-cysteine protein, putative [Plasmodium malariae]|uniref:6-cysteine protein, putative n=1 Tax=Plasmodium malariae TaxID=5858 RepID=A0A1C3K9Y5_PLAMA|nr:6-cysteine protein, putative [Plasmodium malariae]